MPTELTLFAAIGIITKAGNDKILTYGKLNLVLPASFA
jgi:hypothetical protein